MPTTFVTGDLFSAPDLDALAHGCNCAGAMGKGIAVEFKKRFPKMYAEYQKHCRAGTFAVGDVFCFRTEALTVFNLGTQKSWRTKAELAAVERSLQTMIEQAQTLGVRRIGLPRIGAGLGGLSWDAEVKPVLERIGTATSVELVVFETFVKSAPI